MSCKRLTAGIAAAAAMLCFPAMAGADDLTRPPGGLTIEVVRMTAALDPDVCTPSPRPTCGGSGGAGCWRIFAEAGESHWYGSWRHHFNPYWCGNGSVITHIDPSWHYQTASGFYSTNGTARFHVGGCVGCSSISFQALAHFRFEYGTSSSHRICSTMYASYGSNSTYTC
jgi:hypothetical protein